MYFSENSLAYWITDWRQEALLTLIFWLDVITSFVAYIAIYQFQFETIGSILF